MTTIAYDGKSIAVDSRIVRNGDMIATDNGDKVIRRGGRTFFVSGKIGDTSLLVDSYLTGSKCSPRLDAGAIFIEYGQVFRVGHDRGVLWVEKARIPDAMGSGWPHALTAMDMGADAKTAVRMAAKRDTSTGGKIRIYNVGASK